MCSPREIMIEAWSTYRRLWGSEPFSRRLFANCLRSTWRNARNAIETLARIRAVDAAKAARRAADPVAAEREDRIEALQFLPFRYRIAPMVDAIRAGVAA